MRETRKYESGLIGSRKFISRSGQIPKNISYYEIPENFEILSRYFGIAVKECWRIGFPVRKFKVNYYIYHIIIISLLYFIFYNFIVFKNVKNLENIDFLRNPDFFDNPENFEILASVYCMMYAYIHMYAYYMLHKTFEDFICIVLKYIRCDCHILITKYLLQTCIWYKICI